MPRLQKIIFITCWLLLGDLTDSSHTAQHVEDQRDYSGNNMKYTCCFPKQMEGTIFSPLTRSHVNFSLDYTQGRVLISPYYENPSVQSFAVFDLKSNMAYRFENDGSCRSTLVSAPFPTPIAFSRCSPHYTAVKELEPGYLGPPGMPPFRKFQIKDAFHKVVLTVMDGGKNCFPLSTDTFMSYPPIRFNHQYLNLKHGIKDPSLLTPDVNGCQ